MFVLCIDEENIATIGILVRKGNIWSKLEGGGKYIYVKPETVLGEMSTKYLHDKYRKCLRGEDYCKGGTMELSEGMKYCPYCGNSFSTVETILENSEPFHTRRLTDREVENLKKYLITSQ